ncbi:hypothetical protein SAY87_001138 [Trapa incisa]|uniref:DYW domain-containing protein n=1 Tax=Trapa incisa TaxID=236973 RepID=A0AAN7JH34_9MYRT|nr:hypothetical protein SAY87_001138 [Trapa incisa]
MAFHGLRETGPCPISEGVHEILFGLISGHVRKIHTSTVPSLFPQVTGENLYQDERARSMLLNLCRVDDVSLGYIREIHSKIVCCGFGSSFTLSNSLIDLYLRKGLIVYARKVFQGMCLNDSVSWVSMISRLSKYGGETEAALLFCQMHKSGYLPTPYIFSSILSSCAKAQLFNIGEQVHGFACKSGFSSQNFVCNSLITLYCRAGDWVSAERIFIAMEIRDRVSYNSLISGIVQRGFSDKALDLFQRMLRVDFLKPDSVTVASLLGVFSLTGDSIGGKQLHSFVVKAGFLSETVIEGSLLDFYVKCSDMHTAHEFFARTDSENVVLWNIMLVACGQSDDLNASVDLLKKMNLKGIIPNQYTYPSVLKTCTSMGALEEGEQIHAHLTKTGFQWNLYVCGILIDMYAKLGEFKIALGILSQLRDDDVVCWTALISGYVQHDLFIEALQLFRKMQYRGIQLDNIGLASAVSACAGMHALDQGREIHAQSWVRGYSFDISIRNSLISLYSRCGRVQEAYSAFENINTEDTISWNALLSGFSQSGICEEALRVFSKMSKSGVEVSLYTFCSAASAAANMTNMILGKQIHGLVMRNGYDYEIEISNVLITLYAKCGDIDDAQRIFKEMPEKNEVSWNAMITGYSQHGLGNKALNLFEEMKQLGLNPNHVTFLGVISACSHEGLVSKGHQQFQSMNRVYGLVPKPEHYACVVDLLGRSGFLERAKRFVEDMPIQPDAMIWRTLLSACTVHRNVEIGEFAAQKLQEIEPGDSAAYVLQSNMYAVTGKWNQRNQPRQLMKERGVKKEPGQSWIEVKGLVHAFFAGDTMHPLADSIYEAVADMNSRAEEIGYVEQSRSLGNYMEQREQEPMQNVHSEKLAIALGLLCLPERIPIRVIKNLRICNDCHNWIKFVSKVKNRIITVRDTYRFHHFKDGVCSCKNCW